MDKNIFDDSNEYLFKNKYMGKFNFHSGWELSTAFRFAPVCNTIISIKRKFFNDQDIKILDIGCGNSNFYKFWMSNFDSMNKFKINYLGLEYLDSYIEEFNENKEKYNKGRDTVEIIKYNLLENSIKELNKKFHVIILMEIIEHIGKNEAIKIIQDSYNCLEENGILIVSSPNPKKFLNQEFVWPENHLYEFSLEEIKTILKETKFEIFNCLGWLGKANFIKKYYTQKEKELYNTLKNISTGLACAILANNNPNLAECYVIFAQKQELTKKLF